MKFIKKLFKKKPHIPEIIQDRLRDIGPFKAHTKTGIDLSFTDKEWYKKEMTEDGIAVVGHHHFILSATPSLKQVRPQDGYSFVAEMQKSWVLFVMKDVEWQSNPKEMYFAKAVCIEQRMK